jgi:putative ABC transport system permease protein
MIIKSYIKSGIRNFISNKVTSFINVLGLASTIAIGLAVYLIVDQQMNLDQFHPEPEKTFTIQSIIDWDRNEQKWARTPPLLGESFREDFPQIKSMTRVNVKSAVIKSGENIFQERLTFADQDFFKIFDFPLKYGTPSSFYSGKNNIIISKLEAEKYFNNANAIGQELRLIINEKVHLFTVSGVAEDFPKTASFNFNFLLSLDNLSTLYDIDLNTWNGVKRNSVFTFFKLDDNSNLDYIKSGSKKYLSIINQANPDWPIRNIDFEPLTTIAQNSQYTRECLACGSTPEVIIMFGIISLILFISACFNYVNIAIASSSKRLKEIGLRKVIGSSRSKIILQFMLENLVFSFIAVVVGILLAYTLIIPSMNDIFGGVPLELNFFENSRLSIFVLAIFLMVGIGSGAYPAWYISSFSPLEIFSGKEQLVGKNRMTKVFLSLQFFLTFIAIISGLIFTQTNKSQEQQDWGYDQDNLLVIPIKNDNQYQILNQYFLQSTDIVSFSASRSQIGRSNSNEVVEIASDKSSVNSFYIDSNYINTYGLALNWGRDFDKSLKSDVDNSIIVNQTFLEAFHWDLEGENQLKLGNKKYEIVGVVKDFHHNDFFAPLTPTILRISEEDNYRYISVKVAPGKIKKVEEALKATWKQNFPNDLYFGYQQTNVFDTFFESTGTLISVMKFTSIMAIILSSMGLFGLVSLLIIKRLKELSIRNVLGATKLNVLKLITQQFIWIIGIAVLFAIPVSYFTFDLLLSEMFQGSKTEMSVIPFVLTFFIILITIVSTIFYHVNKLMKTNPVENLRMD